MSVWWSFAFAAGLTLVPPEPVHGEPVDVQVEMEGEMAGAELVVTYRPNSAVERTETLALDAGGAVRWTPAEPGIATLSVEAGGATVSQNVSVRFAGIPWAGVLVFFGTGTLLFGGAAFAMRRLFLDQAEGLTVAAPPLDT